jgi:membrane protein implicated in regulation of membrane protease activity
MKNYTTSALVFLVLATTLSSCELVGDIFKAGFYAAFILIAIVVALVIWIFSRFRRRR